MDFAMQGVQSPGYGLHSVILLKGDCLKLMQAAGFLPDEMEQK
jgi:hypothetical protein